MFIRTTTQINLYQQMNSFLLTPTPLSGKLERRSVVETYLCSLPWETPACYNFSFESVWFDAERPLPLVNSRGHHRILVTLTAQMAPQRTRWVRQSLKVPFTHISLSRSSGRATACFANGFASWFCSLDRTLSSKFKHNRVEPQICVGFMRSFRRGCMV